MIRTTSVNRLELGQIERLLLASGLWAATGRLICERAHLAQWLEAVREDHSSVVRTFNERMVPMVSELSRTNGLEPVADFAVMTRAIEVAMKALYGHLNPVVEQLKSAGVDVMIIKGGDLALTAYRPGLPRMMHDIDVLVKPQDVSTTVATFSAFDFVQGSFEREKLCIVPYKDEEKEWMAANHYELAAFRKLVRLPSLDQYAPQIKKNLPLIYSFFVSGHDVYYSLKYDVHLNISRKFAISDMWHKSRQLTLPSGPPVFAQSAADLLWFLGTRIYYETMLTTFGRFHQLIDVVAVAHTFRDEIEWDRIKDIADRYKLHAAIFYVLTHVNNLAENAVPEDVIEFCNPLREGVSRHNDLGDFAAKLFRTTAISRILPLDGGLS